MYTALRYHTKHNWLSYHYTGKCNDSIHLLFNRNLLADVDYVCSSNNTVVKVWTGNSLVRDLKVMVGYVRHFEFQLAPLPGVLQAEQALAHWQVWLVAGSDEEKFTKAATLKAAYILQTRQGRQYAGKGITSLAEVQHNQNTSYAGSLWFTLGERGLLKGPGY